MVEAKKLKEEDPGASTVPTASSENISGGSKKPTSGAPKAGRGGRGGGVKRGGRAN
jgi:hypothetical protein